MMNISLRTVNTLLPDALISLDHKLSDRQSRFEGHDNPQTA